MWENFQITYINWVHSLLIVPRCYFLPCKARTKYHIVLVLCRAFKRFFWSQMELWYYFSVNTKEAQKQKHVCDPLFWLNTAVVYYSYRHRRVNASSLCDKWNVKKVNLRGIANKANYPKTENYNEWDLWIDPFCSYISQTTLLRYHRTSIKIQHYWHNKGSVKYYMPRTEFPRAYPWQNLNKMYVMKHIKNGFTVLMLNFFFFFASSLFSSKLSIK